MRLYLFGPMTGLPDHNIPAFIAARASLESRGHVVVLPADIADPYTLRERLGTDGSMSDEAWMHWVTQDLNLIASYPDIEALVGLPGWEQSRGSKAETYIFHRLFPRPIYDYSARDPLPLVTRRRLDRVHLERSK